MGGVAMADRNRRRLKSQQMIVDDGSLDNQLQGVEDPFNRINIARVRKGKVVKRQVEGMPWHAFSRRPFKKKPVRERRRKRPPGKIHPVLLKAIEKSDAGHRELVIINFADYLRIPRFPAPVEDEKRNSAANRKVRNCTEKLIHEIEDRRSEDYGRLKEELMSSYKIDVLDTFWLINAMVANVRLGDVKMLTKKKDLIYIEPKNAGEEPPQNTNPNDDVDDGRRSISSDPYFNLGLTRGWIGLLDTGVRFTHTQFNSPSHIDFRRDCVNGGADCNSGSAMNPNDDCWNHGTSSAAIITANANQGNAFRGVTGITLDSFKVYPNACGFLDAGAVVRGFENAVRVFDRVIVAEMQGGGNDLSAISRAADNAFDAGAVVVAANGNNGPNAGTVNAPANAHRVIGVGNRDVQTQNQVASQSRGPASGGRFKPDIQAPTNTETASSASDTAFRVFGGTSGATPYAAGAAALLRNWLRGNNFSIDPGQVYAQMVLSGQNPYPFNNTRGAGQLELPTDGWAWWGKVSVQDGDTIDIPLYLSVSNRNTFDGALWWPEWALDIPLFGRLDPHNDIDLHLIDPGGTTRDMSISINSVFERARVTSPIPSGTWRVRIRGYDVNTGSQTVYWAAAAHIR
jgi:hypothetical protein